MKLIIAICAGLMLWSGAVAQEDVQYHSNALQEFLEPMARSNDFPLAGGHFLFYMPERVGEYRGYPVFRKNADTAAATPYSILITDGDCLPLDPVTREELLFAMEIFVQGQLDRLSMFRKASIGTSGETLVQKYEDALRRLTHLLETMTPAERNMQAVVFDPTEILWTKKPEGIFEAQEKKGGRPLVRIAAGKCGFVQVLIR
ncbi:hypothetical protein [Flavihumibacter petaseus]|uniref:Uncharacterized protein n=1 Tax=Flavihumibacter petaseus NBRC 106054 TaxID=1220578 RepID=A0A0E9N3M9_9BACT|nr:hypothetical protein [Flavihumibacter petaseus]GAO44587.1 hypothetical protein FPE01S_03_06250 [Flavihumibacter petaseus NBRC 106054]